MRAVSSFWSGGVLVAAVALMAASSSRVEGFIIIIVRFRSFLCYSGFVGQIKSERVRSLLNTGEYSPVDIASMVGVNYSLVTALRRKMKIQSGRDTAAFRLSKLEQETRDLRRMVQDLQAAGNSATTAVAC